MIYLYAVNIESADIDNAILRFFPIVSRERISKIEKMVNSQDKVRSLLGEVLLRYILWKHYGLGQSNVTFEYNEHGKPFLVSSKQRYFNISHSGNWVLCGVSEQAIGVDVESKVIDPLPIAKRFFSKEEYSYIIGQPATEQIDVFGKIWTLKESFVKCTGTGLTIPLDSFKFRFHDGSVVLYDNEALDAPFSFKCFKLDDQSHVALCIQDGECTVLENKIQSVSIEMLGDWISKYAAREIPLHCQQNIQD